MLGADCLMRPTAESRVPEPPEQASAQQGLARASAQVQAQVQARVQGQARQGWRAVRVHQARREPE